MMAVYLVRGSQNVGATLARKSGAADARRTEQQRIRAEYLELAPHLHPTAAEWDALELHHVALQARCSHPDLGRGTLPGCWKPVGPNQCPDCGHVVGIVDACS